ncbi:hypothetical protein C7T35_01470 [Variovorax sp. WS11]|uniref:hypothetical protein n=1 Tax=Variovorax sp. WS11 TaxID=1105204 RepID=UPI000D0D515E|nr:hypothetical protein [Variovorax sp. WS11]NDZ11477.1 hypothetical protein [Variovorax sp. WS11]PSL86664.1 hypothetical protein C7T35_01470 [Variovorax sp. WS11]
MNATFPEAGHRDELVETLAVAKIPSPIEQDRIEVRMLTLMLTGFFMGNLLQGTIYILAIETSTLHRVAAMTHASWLVAVLFASAALATLPHVVSLLFLPRLLAHRLPRKMACFAAMGTAVLWFYLSALARPLDAGPLTLLYICSGLGALVIAGIFGMSLNAQQLRNLAEKLFP